MLRSLKVITAFSFLMSSSAFCQIHDDAGVKSDENVYLYQQYEIALDQKEEVAAENVIEPEAPVKNQQSSQIKPVFLCISPNKNMADQLKTIPVDAAVTANTLQGVNTKDCKLYLVHDNKLNSESLGLKNENASLGQKLLRSSAHIAGFEVGMLGGLLLLPKSFTNWGNNSWSKIQSNLHRAWTAPPVWDRDGWAINYVSHPHSGSVYYNFMRSQNATMLESFLFAVFQSTAWEYVWEAPFEQPSINDLFATPVGGAIIGELSHRATLAMRKNGFKWYEKAAVIVINPAYWINNGFKTK